MTRQEDHYRENINEHKNKRRRNNRRAHNLTSGETRYTTEINTNIVKMEFIRTNMLMFFYKYHTNHIIM